MLNNYTVNVPKLYVKYENKILKASFIYFYKFLQLKVST